MSLISKATPIQNQRLQKLRSPRSPRMNLLHTPKNTPRSPTRLVNEFRRVTHPFDPDFYEPRKHEEKPFCELYPELRVDALGDMTVSQLLLLEREDFLALSNMDFVRSELLSVYRFLQRADVDELCAGKAKVRIAIDRALVAREASDGFLRTESSSSSSKSKKSTPRSPKCKKPRKKEAEKV